jgi:hypothetical protein
VRLVPGDAQAVTGDEVPSALARGQTIGNDSRLYSTTTKESGFRVIVYTVVWRWKMVKAVLIAGGIEGTVRPEIAVALARKQQKRIRTEVP